MSKLILAIETSIKSGSLALFDGVRLIDGWMGNNDLSRSEDLLPEIARLLARNEVSLNQLNRIAVSIGPGSFTGLRVGIATAKGLKAAVGCLLDGVSILEAMNGVFDDSQNENSKKKTAAVVSAGRNLFFWQTFEQNEKTEFPEPLSKPSTGEATALMSELEKQGIENCVFETVAYESFYDAAVELKTIEAQVFAGNYAALIGRRSALQNPVEVAEREVLPLYIREAVTAKREF